jgi:hypothetical protein
MGRVGQIEAVPGLDMWTLDIHHALYSILRMRPLRISQFLDIISPIPQSTSPMPFDVA